MIGKSLRHYKITVDVLKTRGCKNTCTFQNNNKTCTEEEILKDWELGMIVPIHKKGDLKICSNYRRILLSTTLKLYKQLWDDRLKSVLDNTLHKSQSRFWKGRSAQYHIFTMKEII